VGQERGKRYNSSMDIKGKVAIVTGASNGIGLATARLLAEKGAKVALVARSKDKLEKIAADLKDSLAVPADMTKPEQISKMVETVQKHYGRIDILINNAGQGYDAPVAKINPETLRQIFELDLVGPVIAIEKVAPVMKAKGGGSIINISSGTALMHIPNMGAYAAVKAALAHMSLTARDELKADRINVSVVYPYMTETDFEKNTIKNDVKWDDSGGGHEPPKGDSAEHVAGLILDCIKTGDAEVYAHDWMEPKVR